MIKKNVIFFLVLVCLSIKIEAKICQYLSTIKVNETTSYTYSYPVTYYGKCYTGNTCLLTRWETRVKNRTIERPDIVIESKCCPGWRDVSSNKTRPHYDSDLMCVQDSECVGAGPCYNTTSTEKTNPTTYNASNNDTSLLEVFLRKSTTTTERPQYTNNNHWRNTTSTERNNNENRRYTTSTERHYNHTVPYYTRTPFRYTTSTKRNDNETVPYYRKYTTSTERNYNDTGSYHWRYTTSTERPYYGPVPHVPYNWSRTISKRNYNGTVPSNLYTTSTERNYNDTGSYHWRYTTSTERPYNGPVPYVPYNWRHTTSTKHDNNGTVPSYLYTTSTERNYNDTVPYDWRHTTSIEKPRDPILSNVTTDVELSNNAPTSNISTEEKISGINATEIFNNTESNLINNNVTESTRSLEDNNTTDHDVPFIKTTSSVATMEKEKPITPMCPQLRWILILSCIILTYIAFCLTLLLWRFILLNKKPNEENTFG